MIRYIIIGFIFLTSCTVENNYFYENVVKLKGKHSNYISLDISTNEGQRKYVVNGFNLYRFYQKKSTENYESLVYDRLIKQEPFKIDDPTFLEENFIEVKEVSEVDSIAKFGKERFVNYYFNENGGINKEFINDPDRYFIILPSLINQLFEWEIACYDDSLTGYLILNDFMNDEAIKN